MKKEKWLLSQASKKKKIQEYYKQLYYNKVNNLDAKNKFLETYNYFKTETGRKSNLKRPITSSETESVI